MGTERAIDALSMACQAVREVTAAREAWELHCKHCAACHLAKGHPAFYCDDGFRLQQDVTRAALAATAAEIRFVDAQEELF